MTANHSTHANLPDRKTIRGWAVELGFDAASVAPIQLEQDSAHLQRWLAAQHHGSMDYMARNTDKRAEPAALVPDTASIISLRMHYATESAKSAFARLNNSEQAYISRYALGRDYHKLLRKRLQKLAERMTDSIGAFGYRAFVDSAPVLEKALARNAGLGWIGKHTLVLNRDVGSLFFLGELFTDLPLEPDTPLAADHCGSCSACIDICPTQAIVAPYQLDARRCLSYLTIENRGPIPVEFRRALGNRIFGCDDCQLVCPWNRYAKPTAETDFSPRHGLDAANLIDLFHWDEATFLQRTEGMALRRAGYPGWLRNIAVALGNAAIVATPATAAAIQTALKAKSGLVDALVQEHIDWALEQIAAVQASDQVV